MGTLPAVQSWTSTGYFSNSTGSSITNCQFSLIIEAAQANVDLNDSHDQGIADFFHIRGLWEVLNLDLHLLQIKSPDQASYLILRWQFLLL